MMCACSDFSSFLNQQSPNTSVQDSFIPQVYFNTTRQFVDIKTLNREDRVLSLYDQIVFSNEKDFLSNKDKSPFSLKPLETLTNKKDIKVQVSSFCSQSKTDLKTEQETDRLFQEMASVSSHSSFSIIDLVPQEFLLEYLDKEFYCSFIFAIKNKQKNFTYYSLTQQTIQAGFADSQKSPLALIQETDIGYKYASANHTVHQKNINNTLLLNNTNQVATNYELFCEGVKIIDIPNFKINTGSIFTSLMTAEKWPEEIKTCRFFSKNNKQITGVTRSFRLDFSSLNIKNEPVELSLIEEPVFIDISKKDVHPESFKTWDDLPDWVIEKFARPTPPYISSENSLALNSYIHFTNLNQINQSGNYNSIEVILETKCLDSHPNPERNLFGIGHSISTVVRLPLREKIPIATALPSNIFEMGKAYDHWARELIDLQKKAVRSAEYISKADSKRRSKIFYRRYTEQLEAESALKGMRHQITCLYTIKLESTDHAQNTREFETKAYQILWTREAYGVSYTAFPEGKNPFITLEQQANTNKLRFESIRVRSLMGYLNLTFFDLIETPILQKESYGLEGFALNCNSLSNQNLYLSWPYSSAINNQIVLKDLFLHPDFQSYMQDQDEANCRVLFYEEDALLRYFSGEIRLR